MKDENVLVRVRKMEGRGRAGREREGTVGNSGEM